MRLRLSTRPLKQVRSSKQSTHYPCDCAIEGSNVSLFTMAAVSVLLLRSAQLPSQLQLAAVSMSSWRGGVRDSVAWVRACSPCASRVLRTIWCLSHLVYIFGLFEINEYHDHSIKVSNIIFKPCVSECSRVSICMCIETRDHLSMPYILYLSNKFGYVKRRFLCSICR